MERLKIKRLYHKKNAIEKTTRCLFASISTQFITLSKKIVQHSEHFFRNCKLSLVHDIFHKQTNFTTSHLRPGNFNFSRLNVIVNDPRSSLRRNFLSINSQHFISVKKMSDENIPDKEDGVKLFQDSLEEEKVLVEHVKDEDGVITIDTQPEIVGVESNQPPQTLSKRAKKRARAQRFRDAKKKRRVEGAAQSEKDHVGFGMHDFDETSYYFENGLRKVYPYHYVFSTHAKGRWIGRTLRDVLEKEFGFNHPSELDNAFEEKKISVNDNIVTSDYIIKDCDYISHQIHRHENPVTDAPIEIIEDNDDVIVINKPSSIPCHPCGRYRYNSLVFILGKEMERSNLRNIYRLDRLTSGVLIMGKTAKSTKLLEDQVVKREVQKEYVSRVVGEFPSETITVDQPLKALSNKLRLQVISPSGKSSQTTFERLSFNGHTSVVRCIPHTGRTHQIRVHLQYLGHPIVNDVFYNSDAWGPAKGKGGVYEVSHETTCERIYRTHQATQWEGGDNPLYYEKLKEESSKALASNGDTEVVPESVPTPTLDTDKVILDSDISSSLTVVKDNQNSGDEQTSHSNLDGNLKSPSIDSAQNLNQVDDCRSKFDVKKWIVDRSCSMCRKTTIDPQQKDLVMFLHALKYKGPGWEYETKLPDWAEEDWNGEDKFSLESTLQEDTLSTE